MFEKTQKAPKKPNVSNSTRSTKPNFAKKTPSSAASAAKTPPPAPAKSTVDQSANQSTTIGASIKIKGELSGEEDLVIQGNVEGTVKLKDNSISVSEQGKVQADVYARSIIVQGELSGDLYGTESVTVARSGRVNGNIIAPRVVLEDGAQFKGNIDMDSKNAGAAHAPDTAVASTKPSTA